MKSEQKTIDFNTASYEELRDYVLHELIFGDSKELFSILKGHVLIEWTIETLIERKQTFNKEKLGFYAKVELAETLGVLPEAYCLAAKELNKIRNAYAHQKTPKLEGTLINNFDSLKKIWESESNFMAIYETAERVDDKVNVAMILLNASFLKLLS